MAKENPKIRPVERHGLALSAFESVLAKELRAKGLRATVTRVKNLEYRLRPTRLMGSFEIVLAEDK